MNKEIEINFINEKPSIFKKILNKWNEKILPEKLFMIFVILIIVAVFILNKFNIGK